MSRYANTLALVATFGVIALTGATANAQEKPTEQTPRQALVIENVKLHTVAKGTIEKGSIAIGADGVILEVSAGAVSKPAGARVIDGAGKVLTPGFIDVHTSLGAVDIWAVAESVDVKVDMVNVRPAFRVEDAFNPRSSVIPITRAGGVTSVVVVPSGGLLSGQSSLVELGSATPGAFATIVDGSAASHLDLGARGGKAVGGSRAAIYHKLRLLFDDARFYKKSKAAFDEGKSRPLSAPRLELEALAEVLDKKLPLVAEIDRASGVERAVAFSKKQGFTLILSGAREAWLVRELLAREKVPVILYPLANLPASFDALGAREDNAALLEQAGVPIMISTYEAHNVRNLRQLAGNAVRAGMSYEGALRAITLTPAETFGVAAKVGSLEKGKKANIVLWSGDPFEFSTKPEAMWIDGRPTPTTNRQDSLRERYMKIQRRMPPSLPRGTAVDEPPSK